MINQGSKKSFALNSKWTHQKGQRGWKHFRIVGKRKQINEKEIEMMAVCDRSVRFWLLEKELATDPDWRTDWL